MSPFLILWRVHSGCYSRWWWKGTKVRLPFHQRLNPAAAFPLTVLWWAAAVRVTSTWGAGCGVVFSLSARAYAHLQDPAQLVTQNLFEPRREGQGLQRVYVVGQQLAYAGAAQVLEGCTAAAWANNLHAALSSCRADHWKQLLVPQLCGCYT